MNIVTYLKSKREHYISIIPSLQKYVELQSSKLYSSMDSLKDISSHPLFVCVFKFCLDCNQITFKLESNLHRVNMIIRWRS